MGHLVLGMVKDLLTEHLQNIEIILTNVHIFHGTFTDVVDEGHPTGLPLVFDYLHQNRVAFVEDVVHRFWEVIHCTKLQDVIDDVALEGGALVLRQG